MMKKRIRTMMTILLGCMIWITGCGEGHAGKTVWYENKMIAHAGGGYRWKDND